MRNYHLPTSDLIDLDMGDGTSFPSPEEIRLQTQLDMFAPGGAATNKEVHAVLLKQLTAARADAKNAKSSEYTKLAHFEGARAIENHKKWLLKELAKEDEAIAVLEAETAKRKDRSQG